ncbi:tetratricopeptide repeat protein [Nannocystis sp.]|uniref:tetratricopeptide repeat protein n=1 Tax=Nannocystis sp. TaxID=1962667 RepID=UPI0025EB87D1|nr:tetratricopeptide repeat protein [Nannocystis sp.]MBK7828686.1 tetratricopeptide repeat protein [Nannocystis sp.]
MTTADGAGDDDERASATTDLVRAIGMRQARFDEGLRVAELARGNVSRLPDRRGHEARLETRVGEILLQRRDFDAAERHIDRAMELNAELYGEASTVYAAAVNIRATLHFLGAKWPEALKEYQRVAAIYEQAYGPSHPLLGNVLNNIGAVQLSQFDYSGAEATYTRALEILRGAHGPNHPALATVYANLGMIALAQAQFPRAIEELRRALAVYEGSLPANHPDIGDALLELGNGYLSAGQHAEAEQTYARALAVYLQSFGVGHERATLVLARLGMAQLRGGRRDDAALSFQRALTEFRGDASDPVLGFPHAGLGQLRLDEGNYAAAATELETALERLGRSPTAGPHDRAEVQFALARALLGRDPTSATRARPLAIEARAGFLQFGAAYAGAVAEIDAWTARLPPTP